MFPFSNLRVIPFEYFSGIDNMALDLVYAQKVAQDQVPILRFYGWEPFCLSLGHHQNKSQINLDRVKQDCIGLVRRPTGGSAIFHANELTYSFIIPKGNINHHEMYSMFHALLTKALNGLGIPVSLNTVAHHGQYLNVDNSTFACFNRSAKDEIQFEGKKVVGSAQKIFKHSILQHGSIILGKEHEQIISYLNNDPIDGDKQKELLKINSVHLNQIVSNSKSKAQVAAALTDQFSLEYTSAVYYQYPSKAEKAAIKSHTKDIEIV
jgi:lipoyl(octanoyl) transferase